MNSIQDAISEIKQRNTSKSAVAIGRALASACNKKYGFSILECSIDVDMVGKNVVKNLWDISFQADFSNKSQDDAINFLEKHFGIEEVTSWEKSKVTMDNQD